MNALWQQLHFAHPAALWALLALPLLWWLLRATPPRPTEVRFAPLRLLLRLPATRRQPLRTPWWLLALRLALAGALILALAGPRLTPPRITTPGASPGPLLLVVDDGFAAAHNWPAIQGQLTALLAAAREEGRPVILATTTPRAGATTLIAMPPATASRHAAALSPQALTPDRAALLARLRAEGVKPGRTAWLSDGIDHGNAASFAAGLRTLGAPLVAYLPPATRLPVMIEALRREQGALRVHARRALATGPASHALRAHAANGRLLAEVDIDFPPDSLRAETRLRLPAPLRNEIATLRIAGQPHAGATWLLDDRAASKTVLILSGEPRGRDQPLLSPAYYIARALSPFAQVGQAASPREVRDWLRAGLSMLVLADVGRLPPALEEEIAQWVRAGGLLLRFAGPRLAGGSARLLPVALRRQARTLGATLSWQQPQPLAPIAEDSPLAGIAVDKSVRVRRQVLAEPGAALAERTLAALADGTPLITAARHARGWLALVHTTADPQWSDLPLSGMFVHLLRRFLDMAPPPAPFVSGATDAPSPRAETKDIGTTAPRRAAFTPLRVLDGAGRLHPPPVHVLPVPAARMRNLKPSAQHPPGIYARGQQRRALNAARPDLSWRAIENLPPGVARASYATARARDLAPPLLTLAATLFLLDMAAMLLLAGGLSRARRPGVAALLLALTGAWQAAPLHAQQSPDIPARATPGQAAPAEDAEQRRRLAFAMKATRETRLAFVRTGDARVDAISRAGLFGLSEFLYDRTSVEPGEPMAVDIERDDISLFPLLYWPVLPDAPALSSAALQRLSVFLKNGGSILFDTRDAPDAAADPATETPARAALRRLLEKLDIPPLEPVPRHHVLTRAFYLLQSFPGRHDESPLWVEATSIGRERRSLSPANADGVSAVLITGNDMAAAWAITESGRPLLPVVPGGARQREQAIRAGINIVMYALTGNYKADQVHLPAIIQRLGQ